jgi:hypothetical protein
MSGLAFGLRPGPVSLVRKLTQDFVLDEARSLLRSGSYEGMNEFQREMLY